MTQEYILVSQESLNIARHIFDFFRDVSGETTCFESISGKHLSKSGLKTYGFVRDIPKQVKQTLRRSATESPNAVIYIEFA